MSLGHTHTARMHTCNEILGQHTIEIIHIYVYWCTIQNSQAMEPAQMSISRGMDKGKGRIYSK